MWRSHAYAENQINTLQYVTQPWFFMAHQQATLCHCVIGQVIVNKKRNPAPSNHLYTHT
jgi:hypothetical protein